MKVGLTYVAKHNGISADKLIAFAEKNPSKYGLLTHGKEICTSTDYVNELVEDYKAEQKK